MSNESIIVRGARVHNLKNIDVEIPHNQLTVVTGVSGSGKSSLAFDTIYAEGQRRYVESLSAYARQFLERIEKPDADLIDGIAPAVAIKQKNSTRNPRSTVATATEIYDYLRLLFARVGRTYCDNCGGEVKKDTVDEIADRLLAMPEGTRFNVLFPLVQAPAPVEPEKKPKGRKPKKQTAPAQDELTKERLFELRKRGFNRLFQTGQIFEFSTPESLLDIDFSKPVYLLVDRIATAPDNRSRIVDAIESAYREAGEVIFETAPREEGGAPERLRFAQRFECKNCHVKYDEPEPRLFSFNNPYGACPKCQGFGNTIDFDMDLVVPDPTLTLNGGAIEPWTKPKYRPLGTEMKRYARSVGIPLDTPWRELTKEQRDVLIEGDGKYPGVRGFFNHLERKKYKLHVRVFLSRYRGYSQCSSCGGARLRTEARNVRVAGKNICEVTAMTVEEATKFFSTIQLTREETEIAGKLLEEIQSLLRFLNEVGLEYLSLNRLASTLSGGEAQRIQLATSLGSRLVGTLYVLDEPSIGLHSRDTNRLIHILHDLRDLGNTILVVEHDPEIMQTADRILDLGPGAGENGGKLVAAGTYNEIKKNSASLTGRYLADELHIPMPTQRREPNSRKIVVKNAYAHNLKGIDVEIPLGMMVVITGVSGSGKSTLVHDILYQGLATEKRQVTGLQLSGFESIEGAEYIDEVVLVDQSPIGRTPRSNPITYIKAFDAIREHFASLPESQKRGYAAGHFSFNIPGGRCENCQGDGTVTVEMQFLADVELICEECKGTRYKPEILEIRYHGKNIHEVLDLTVKSALQFFSGSPKIVDKLRVLDEVGLGYLRLGQSATTLSGGEAQRMKLALHLQPKMRDVGRPATTEDGKPIRRHPRMLYIFDEPTTGLHFDDVSKLLAAFKKLIDAGGSIIVIEHNLDVVKTADWVIDLGPEGGNRGGNLVVTGTPEKVAKTKGSYTGQWLAKYLPIHGNGSHD
ncbi:Excinuclease ABC subunit A [Candidatus Koribacter versatilis Ellin345]|uniref:UvrABC system protein A n=1 Tax=Koribacter versatilis (strain Ellin345) TaxID=204669 RepID=Q1IQ27_KORVE|nr:excinuclease ABC subunit UvrA [Candidatus Koribacter versatilis]ABF41023.1 Excinuclease ABC subunit A [Candidatus Koribacter versatilis Ellin345]